MRRVRTWISFQEIMDPSVTTVMRSAQEMPEYGPDWIVAIGGGSPINAARAMWIKYEYPEITFEG